MDSVGKGFKFTDASHQAANFIPPEDHGSIVEALKRRYESKLVFGHFAVHSLNLSNSKIAEGIESNVREVIALEVSSMCKYLKRVGCIFRTTIYAGYTILAKVMFYFGISVS